MDKAKIIFPDKKEYEANVIVDNMGGKSIDVSSLRKETGYITYDPGFMNTGSCESSICYIDGEKGILRYRGYNLEDLIKNCDFVEVAYLLVKGTLPNKSERAKYMDLLNRSSLMHVKMKELLLSFPHDAHPMSMLTAMVASLSAFYPEIEDVDPEINIDITVTRLLSKMRTIAAAIYRNKNGMDIINPEYKYSYCANFLNMMFYTTVNGYEPNDASVKALNKLLILHADHEQNCSTTAVRLVCSSGANLYASVAAGCAALWGPKHGGANMEVMNMLQSIYQKNETIDSLLEKAKSKDNPYRLPGFGHRIYKTFDPRAKIAKEISSSLLSSRHVNDPLLDIALEMEEKVTKDNYFIERNLYPNVDFYTGLCMRMLGIPVDMYTVLFAIGRLPGWISHFIEWRHDDHMKIGRPRQVYMGEVERKVLKIEDR